MAALTLPAGCLLDGVEPQALAHALDASIQLQCSRGEVIYSPRDFRRCLGLILSGSVRVTKDALVVSTLHRGDLFGAAALFSDRDEYATTLTALSDCGVLFLPESAVERLLAESPVFAGKYVRYLSGRIRFLSQRLDTVTAGSTERKLAQFLLQQADSEGALHTSATLLCKTLGVGRASLYRAFERLEQDGAIRRDGKSIYISDPSKLQEL